MASFNFSVSHFGHYAHAALQRAPKKSLLALFLLGSLLGGGVSILLASSGAARAKTEVRSLANTIGQMQETTAKLQAELAQQPPEIQRLHLGPILATQQAFNDSGYTEQDVAYWASQMELFGQMTGLRLEILGRAASKYSKAMQITVSVSAFGPEALSPFNTAQALDFLQVYGYVESFDGKEARIHIAQNPSVSLN